jgi:hypothetical protein
MSTIGVLGGLRASVGAGAWLAPAQTGRLFGLDAEANQQLPYVARLFGIRDVALAAGALMTVGDSRRLWLKIGIVCDAADAVAGVLAGRAGEVSKTTTALVTGTALFAVALGISALSAGDDITA